MREFVDRRHALQVGDELLADLDEARVALLYLSRDPYRPAAITEVATDLPGDVRDGEGREPHAPVGIEPVDGLQQTDGAGLDEVVVGLSAVDIAPRDVVDKGHGAFDELSSCLEVAFAVISVEERLLHSSRCAH